jgi:parvulin-like peptidyl-prolyl isomerase
MHILAATALVLLQTETRPASRPSQDTLVVASVADRVVGIINDEVITQSEVDARLANLIATQGIKGNAAIERARQDETLKMAIQLLLTQAARKLSFDERQIDEGTRKRIAEEEKRGGGRTALHRNIQAQGKSVAEWEREQRNAELMERLLMSEIGFDYRPEKEVVVTPTMLRAYYKDHLEDFKAGPMVRGRLILISDARSRTRANSLARAKDLAQKLKSGADFVDVAREHSEHRPAQGGLLGWVENDKTMADPPILEYLFSHEPGSVSDPIEIEGAVAIVRVEDKRPAGLRPFNDLDTQEEITRRLFVTKRRELQDALIRRLRAEAYVWPENLLPR